VKRISPRRTQVSADGEGLASHAGSMLPHEIADRMGLTRALSRELRDVFPRQPEHDPGAVLRDLAVMLVDGGDCLGDLGALREHPDLFGSAASDATAWRIIERLGTTGLEPLRQARGEARVCAWECGTAPKRIILDMDATLITAHSEKEGAAPTTSMGLDFIRCRHPGWRQRGPLWKAAAWERRRQRCW